MLKCKDGLDHRRYPAGCFAMTEIRLVLPVLLAYWQWKDERWSHTAPSKRGEGRLEGKNLLKASTSIGSPTLVPVPWHSTYEVPCASRPALR